MVGLERVERLLERAGRPGDALLLLGGHLVDVLVDRAGGSILLMTPSRPAISWALNERYGLQVGSGERNSSRRAPGVVK